MKRSYRYHTFYTLFLLFFIYMFDFADRKIMSVLFPFIKEEWDLGDMQLSMLGGVVSLMVAIFVIPSAIIVDRWSRKKMIALMVFIWSIMTLMCAFAQNYYQLLLFRALIGIGEAAYAPAAIAMISKIFPPNHRGKYIGIYDAAAPLGIALGMAVGGYIGMMYGWRYAFGYVAIPGILLSVLMLFAKDYKTLPLYEHAQKTQFSLKTISSLFSIKTLVLVFFAFACVVGVNTAMIDWAPSYFIRFHGLTESQAGYVSGLIALCVLIGAPLGGWLGDRASLRYSNGKVLVCFIGTLASAISLGVALLLSHTSLAIVFFCLFGVFSIACLAPGTAIIQDLVQPGLRSVAFGVNVVVMSVFGAVLFLFIVGLLSDMYSLHIALLFLPIAMAVGSLLFFLSRTSYVRDYKNVSKEIADV